MKCVGVCPAAGLELPQPIGLKMPKITRDRGGRGGEIKENPFKQFYIQLSAGLRWRGFNSKDNAAAIKVQ